MKKVVVVGAGAAGMVAAVTVKKKNPEWKVMVFDRSPDAGWAGCPIPYFLAGELPFESVSEYNSTYFYKNRGIEVYTGHEVKSIDPSRNCVNVEKIMDTELAPELSPVNGEVGYDELIYAVGALPVVPSSWGVDPGNLPEGVFFARNPMDARKIHSYIQERSPETAVIIGAGFIGMEMAYAFYKRGLKVTIVEKLPEVLSFLSPKQKRRLNFPGGVVLKTSTSVEKISRDSEKIVVKTDSEELRADIVLIATGVKPNVALAKDAGVETAVSSEGIEGIKIDTRGRTSVPNIWAGGDVVVVPHIIKGGLTYAPLGDVADKQALVIARNMSGEEAHFRGVMGTFISHAFGKAFGKAGLGYSEMVSIYGEGNFDVVDVAGFNKVGRFSDSKRADFSVYVVKEDGKPVVKGVSAIGEGCVAQFLDVFSAAIYFGATVDDLLNIDYAYCPATSTVWNPALATYRRYY